MHEVVFHVGYPKTASTWMQRVLFPRVGGLDVPWTTRALTNRIVKAPERDWLRDLPQFRRDLEAARAKGPVMVSSENFVGGHRGGSELAGLIGRLAQLAPDAKILIVIREQVDLLASWYAQSIREGSSRSLDSFLEPLHHRDMPSPAEAWLDYDAMAARFEASFGKGSVTLVPFEVLRADTTAFAERALAPTGLPVPTLADDTGKATNVRLGPLRLAVLRRVNALWGSNNPHHVGLVNVRGRHKFVKFLGRLGGRRTSRRMHAKIAAWAGTRFRESNGALAARVPEDLGALGYET